MGPARFLCATLLKTPLRHLQRQHDKTQKVVGDRHAPFVGHGELAQMVERSLCMREVPGSMPGFSIIVR